MGLFKKGAQFHEYYGLKNEVMNCYKPKSKSCFLSQFETNEEKSIYNLIVYKNPKDAIHINNLNNINGHKNIKYYLVTQKKICMI